MSANAHSIVAGTIKKKKSMQAGGPKLVVLGRSGRRHGRICRSPSWVVGSRSHRRDRRCASDVQWRRQIFTRAWQSWRFGARQRGLARGRRSTKCFKAAPCLALGGVKSAMAHCRRGCGVCAASSRCCNRLVVVGQFAGLMQNRCRDVSDVCMERRGTAAADLLAS